MMANKPKKGNATEPSKRDPGTLQIDERFLKDGELEKAESAPAAERATFSDKVIARAVNQPEVRAARTIQRFEGDNLNINDCIDELREQSANVLRGDMQRAEAMLMAQAHTLDALFSTLALRSKMNSDAGYLDAADRYLRLAFKAQSQCRTTLETLTEIKNPRPVAFVRQANITSGPQQINNGTAAPSQAREIESEQTQLSGGSHELLPNARASGQASRVNPALETLGEIDRAEVLRG